MTLFYDTSIEINTQEFIFSREESKHIAKVLRKSSDEIVTITDVCGLEWNGKLSLVTPNKTIAQFENSMQHKASNNQIHLAIAPTKNNNRMEWMLEKLTELGVASITPLKCDHSERKVIKKERFEKIIIAGLKQAQHFFLPKMNEMISFKEYVKANKAEQTLIAHCEDQPKKRLIEVSLTGNHISLMIGPEGDFSPHEIEYALDHKSTPVSLGEQRFRTETAGLLGCHTLFIKQQQKTIL